MTQGTQIQNPFQSPNLKNLSWWQGVALNDEKNAMFEELTQKLEDIFCKSIENGKLAHFVEEYKQIASDMIKELPSEPILQSILDHALRRLVNIYCYRRQRSTSSLAYLQEDASIVTWALKPNLLTKAIDQANRMEQLGVPHEKFNLISSPRLLGWVFRHYWPIVRKVSGMMAMPIPVGNIRCITLDEHADSYKDRFRHHRFGNHHYDEDVYSLPLIIYLSEVDQGCGPFEYISGADKYSQRYVLKAFHQAVNHDCDLTSLEDKNFPAIAKLPSVFRGGSVMGNLYSQDVFEKAGAETVTGSIGTAIMFDGFNLIHAGGFPSDGCRKSLFINFRFPLSKAVSKFRYRFTAS